MDLLHIAIILSRDLELTPKLYILLFWLLLLVIHFFFDQNLSSIKLLETYFKGRRYHLVTMIINVILFINFGCIQSPKMKLLGGSQYFGLTCSNIT